MGASSKNWKVKRTMYVILNSLVLFQGREIQGRVLFRFGQTPLYKVTILQKGFISKSIR